MLVLTKELRRTTNVLLALLVLGVWGLLISQFIPKSFAVFNDATKLQSASFKTLTVERINVVDPDGTLRLAIANRAHPPDLIYRGKTYPKRSIDDLVGFIFYEADGDEAGGLGLAQLRDSKQTAFIFDYTHQLTDGIGIVKREADDGAGWKSGFFISDRRPHEPGDIKSSQGVERVWLSNENQNAALVISDPVGRPRIRIGVDEAGVPAIQMFDDNGAIVFAATESSQKGAN